MPIADAYTRLTEGMSGPVRRDEPMARHTTYRIGGPAALFLERAIICVSATATSILAEEEVVWTVLGKGSNVLVSDEGYDGAVLTLGRDFKRHALDGDHLRTGAGVVLAAVVQDAFQDWTVGTGIRRRNPRYRRRSVGHECGKP